MDILVGNDNPSRLLCSRCCAGHPYAAIIHCDNTVNPGKLTKCCILCQDDPSMNLLIWDSVVDGCLLRYVISCSSQKMATHSVGTTDSSFPNQLTTTANYSILPDALCYNVMSISDFFFAMIDIGTYFIFSANRDESTFCNDNHITIMVLLHHWNTTGVP